MTLPKKCIVDTNVPKLANAAFDPKLEDELLSCSLACVEAIEHVIKQKSIVLDDGDEIFNEYRGQLNMKGQPGQGDIFMKWVHDNRHSFPAEDRVTITPNGDSYDEFPDHEGLKDFDRSDRKFIAVAHAHREDLTILQATDSKWWGCQAALGEVGITVRFLCEKYIKAKYKKKMES